MVKLPRNCSTRIQCVTWPSKNADNFWWISEKLWKRHLDACMYVHTCMCLHSVQLFKGLMTMKTALLHRNSIPHANNETEYTYHTWVYMKLCQTSMFLRNTRKGLVSISEYWVWQDLGIISRPYVDVRACTRTHTHILGEHNTSRSIARKVRIGEFGRRKFFFNSQGFGLSILFFYQTIFTC